MHFLRFVFGWPDIYVIGYSFMKGLQNFKAMFGVLKNSLKKHQLKLSNIV